MSRVREFYAGQNVFITGVTGFLGKVLLEKLLRDCHEIDTIFVLVRVKKGKNIQERIHELLAQPVFDQLRSDHPEFAEKIISVSGDITEEGLGLSATDYERIVDKVSVIFHLAATVRFNEKLDVATAINTNSVKHIVDIAKACKNLQAGVHVSTAYSHCVRDVIGEELYPPPLSYEAINKLVETIPKNESSEDARNDFTEKVLGKWPNTYTFTKAIGESVVAEFAKELPFAIFRPSIAYNDKIEIIENFPVVMNAYKEPMKGWIPGPMGYPGIVCGVGLGLVHVVLTNKHCQTDPVPVDYVCNALISSAWEIANTERRCSEDISVYNYVSGSENPITWGQLGDKMFIAGDIYSFNSAVCYPFLIYAPSLILFGILEFFLHLIPALIIDRIAVLLGKKPRFYQIARKVGNELRAFRHFTTHECNFENRRVQNLWKRLTTEDRRIFPFSMRDLDWDEYSLGFFRGLRKYLIGEHEGSLDKARRRYFYLYVIYTIVRLLFAAFALWIILILLQKLGLNINT